MDDLRVETSEAPEQPKGAAPPPRVDSGRAASVLVSLGLVLSLLVSGYVALSGEARSAFRGMDSSANLANAIVVMTIALSFRLPRSSAGSSVIVTSREWGCPHRRGPLVTACVCFILGLTSISVVASAVKRVEHDAVVSFQESLDAAAIEADGVAHLEWMAASLELDVVGDPRSPESRASSPTARGEWRPPSRFVPRRVASPPKTLFASPCRSDRVTDISSSDGPDDVRLWVENAKNAVIAVEGFLRNVLAAQEPNTLIADWDGN